MTKSNAPLVSVIIPAFNSGEWLAQAIDSALGQTYPNVEIVVVNDGSTDLSTREIAYRYIPRITYIERENGGVAAARNTGLAASTGELIALLDQDDVWLRHKLEVEVRAWLARPHVALVHSSYHIMDGQERSTSTQGDRKRLIKLREREYQPLPGLLVDVPICSATTLFPRQMLDEVGMFDPALSGTDDWDLWLRMAARGYTFYCVGEPLAEYRMHAANTSRNIDLMVGGVLRTLDKFYAQPVLPPEALRFRSRVFSGKHAWAASLYYGAGRTQEAGDHLHSAARYYPQSIATGHFLQSMIYSTTGSPSPEAAKRAVAFTQQTLSKVALPPSVERKLRAYSRAVLALHVDDGLRPRLVAAARAFMTDPTLATDPGIWTAARRVALRAGKRAINHIPSLFLSRVPKVPGAPWYPHREFKYGGALSLATLVPNGSHGRMLAMVPPGSRVLETGCANGRFSRVLVEHGCQVVGVELDPDAASEAADVCEQVIVGDLEDPSVQARIPDGFDLVLFGDVLEHLVRPWEVLRALRSRLAPGGSLVISVPNVAHWDVRMSLLIGKFEYQYDGLLDGTHLRFFTQRTLQDMLEWSGYFIVDSSRVTTLPAWTYSIRLVRRVAPHVLLPLLERLAPNLFTFQFVVKAVPSAGGHDIAQ